MSFLDVLKEYFRWTRNREPEGWFSWQHIVYVTAMIAIAVVAAILCAKKTKGKGEKEKYAVMKVAAILMLFFESFKIILISFRNQDPKSILGMLPLFLCSIQLFAMPICAFAKGRIRDAATLFVFIFGPIGCLGGTYLAGNYFSGSPVISFDVNCSVTTHCLAGFSAIYVGLAGLVKIDKKNLLIDGLFLLLIECLALTANHFLEPTPYESNYMFLTKSAGTPYEIVMTMAFGIKPLYTFLVGFLNYAYAALFIGGCYLYKSIKKKTGK